MIQFQQTLQGTSYPYVHNHNFLSGINEKGFVISKKRNYKKCYLFAVFVYSQTRRFREQKKKEYLCVAYGTVSRPFGKKLVLQTDGKLIFPECSCSGDLCPSIDNSGLGLLSGFADIAPKVVRAISNALGQQIVVTAAQKVTCDIMEASKQLVCDKMGISLRYESSSPDVLLSVSAVSKCLHVSATATLHIFRCAASSRSNSALVQARKS